MWEATKEKRNVCKRDVAGTVALSFFHYIYQGMIFVIQVVRFIMCLLSLASGVFFFWSDYADRTRELPRRHNEPVDSQCIRELCYYRKPRYVY